MVSGAISPLRHSGLRRRLTLLCSASIIALASTGSGHAGQLPLTAFQAYNAALASSIVAGPFALYAVPVNSISPTQMNEGFTEVGKKTAGFNLLAPSTLTSTLLTDIEPVIIGPGGQLYLTDGHHTFTALQNSIYGASNPTVYVVVIANYSNLTTSQFYSVMQANNFLLPLNDGVPQTVDTSTGSPIPSTLTALTNDPYRGLEYSILKNKSAKLFTTAANITGAVGSGTPGLDKMTGFYSDFLEAAAYRGANGGLGLAYLSPGDIAIATKWNLTPGSTTTLPNVAGTVTAAQLPGFILNQNIAIGSVISNATLANGALDGDGTFTGITQINAGTAAAPIMIGTPNTGFIMELGADNGNTVTLSGANTYTGGTSILAGTLIIASDSSLGAAVPAGAIVDPTNVLSSVKAANGIVFNSLSEGNGTLQIGTASGNGTSTFTTARPIAVDGEAATINVNGYLVNLTGQIISLGANGTGLGNATGVSDLTIDDNSSNKGVLTLSTASPYFYGNLIIGNSNAPTVRVMNDAALGNTTGPSYTIGQIDLNGGTLQAGASFTATERNLFLGGGSTFDVNGFNTSWGTLTDVQRTLVLTNSNTTTAGAVTFSSLAIGATATLQLSGGAAGETVSLTNGISRQTSATLIFQPTSSSSLGTSTEEVFSGTGAASLVNGIAPVWMVTNNGVSKSAGPYDFLTYGANGYVKATYGATAVSSSTGTTVVDETANQTLSANAAAYALKIESGKTITLGSNTLTLGDGVNAAGLSLAAATPISGGTLAFGSSEAVMWLGATSTINSILTGTGGLTIAGSGSLALTGSSTMTGPIYIDSGTLTLGAANYFATDANITLADTKSKPAAATFAITANNTVATLNSVGSNSAVNISNGATLTIGDSQNLSSTLSSTITQSGAAATALVKAGTGLLDLSGGKIKLVANGSIAVTGGQLRVAASSFTGTSPTSNTIALSSGTELQFAQNGGGQFSDTVTGAGVLHLIGGTLQITGTSNTYSGGTIVEAGSTLDLTTANVSSGNANIANAGGLVVFDQATNGTYSGVISDARQMEATTGSLLSGSLVKDDSTGASSGNVTLAAVQAYSGGTFIEAGTLTLGVANAVATSSGVDLGRVGGPLGTGAAAAGTPVTATLALGANNTIQGLMSEAGNNTAVQLNGNTLTINMTTSNIWSFGGAITGTGGLVMSGAGTELLTGASTYTGLTTVNGGTLSVNGSITSSVLVNAGGTLGGNGTVGSTTINGGTLSPGNSIGTLTVNGSLVLTSAATYLVEVSTSSADATIVTGTAALNGTVQAAFQSGSYTQIPKSYTILTSAGLGGTTFSTLATTNMPAALQASLSYTATNVNLNLTSALGQIAGLNRNQAAVGNAIDTAFNNSSGGVSGGFATLLGLSAASIPGALTQLSGETTTGAQQVTFGAMTQFMGSLLDPFAGGRDDGLASIAGGASQFADEEGVANAYASTGKPLAKSERDAFAAMYTKAPVAVETAAQRWSVWVAGYGGSQTTDGNAGTGSSSTSSRAYGTSVGADYRISPFTVAGFALAGGGTNFSVANVGTGRSDLFQAGAFIRHTVGAAYISGALAYGWQNITTDRSVTLAGAQTLHANFDANAFSGRIEGGYRFATPWMGVTPYAAAQVTMFDLPAYGEQVLSGVNTFALSYAAKDVTDTRSELGFRTDRSYALTDAILTLRGRAAWAHDFNTDRSIAATFQSLPAASFVVNGAAPSHDAALTTASAEIKWTNGFSVAATFEGEFSNVTESYTGKGVVRYTW